MRKNKKSKKNSDEKLREILDNISVDDLSSEEKKYLSSLAKRVEKKSTRDELYSKNLQKNETDEPVDSLKPTVVVHPRPSQRSYKPVEIKKIEPEITKTVVEKPKIEEKPIEEALPEEKPDEVLTDKFDKKDDLFEVEKVEVSEPEFIEVKPKVEKVEEKTAEEERPEWEPVEEENFPEEKPLEEPVTEEKPEEEPKEEKLSEEISKEEPVTEEITKEEPAENEIELAEKIEEPPEWEPVEEEILTDEKPEIEPSLEEISENEEIEEKIEETEKFEEKIPDEEITELKEKIVEEETLIDEEPEIEEKQEPVEIKEDDLTEWEPIEIKDKKGLSEKDFCPNCGKKFEGNTFSFCPDCGHRLDEEEKEEIPDKEEKEEKAGLLPSFIPVRRNRKKDEILEAEPVKGFDEKIEKEIKDAEDFEESIEKQEIIDEKIEEEKIEKPKKQKKKIRVKRRVKEDNKIEPEIDEETFEIKEDKSEKEIKTKQKKKTKKGKKEKTLEGKGEEQLVKIDKKEKIQAFKEIKCIDEKTAILLYDTGFFCVDDLRNCSVNSLKSVNGISGKLVKKIKKEIKKIDDLDFEENGNGFSEYIVNDDADKDNKSVIDEKILEGKGEYFDEEKESKKIVFKGVLSIDEKTADLLIKNGISSLDILRETPIDELTKIKGIRRKTAKQIKREIKDLPVDEDEDFSLEDDDLGEWEYFDEEDEVDDKPEEIKGYKHGNFVLYEKIIKGKGNQKRTVRFFSKSKPDEGEPIKLPKGYEVKENKKTGVPYIRKKKK